MEGIKDTLIKYGEHRKNTCQIHEKLLDISREGFSALWSRHRKEYPYIGRITHTAYRKYIETQSKLHLSEDEQRNVSVRLLHRFEVAKQHYQGIPNLQSKALCVLVKNLL